MIDSSLICIFVFCDLVASSEESALDLSQVRGQLEQVVGGGQGDRVHPGELTYRGATRLARFIEL